MNNIRFYVIRTYEKQILHNYYYQIVTHEGCDARFDFYHVFPLESINFFYCMRVTNIISF
jgi:hypothetical protein